MTFSENAAWCHGCVRTLVSIEEVNKGQQRDQDRWTPASFFWIGWSRPLFDVIRRYVPARLRGPLGAMWREVLFPRHGLLLQGMRQIEGWLSDSEAVALYRAVGTCNPPIVAVEIGSWYGKSSVMIAGGIRDGGGGILYAIDPFEGLDGYSVRRTGQRRATDFLDPFLQNINHAGLAEFVRPIRGYSYDVAENWSTPIDLLFIDGDHEYEAVKRDFEDWSPHLREGGIIIFHDTNGSWPGPTQLAREELHSPSWQNVRCVGSLTIARKSVRTKSASSRGDGNLLYHGPTSRAVKAE